MATSREPTEQRYGRWAFLADLGASPLGAAHPAALVSRLFANVYGEY